MIYLDSAATTFQKPRSVLESVLRAMESMSSPGRGSYASAALAADTLLMCRMELAQLLEVEEPEQVVFTTSATHGLNIAIHSLVPPGGRVVISGYEHNAVTRALHGISGVSIHVANTPLFDRRAILRAFQELVTDRVDAVICTHVSNVFGWVLPIEEIAAICRRRKVPLIVDAAQSAGMVPISQKDLGAAFIAMPGHKGLYGPQGTGVLVCGQTGTPLLRGGTGSESRLQDMPEFLPDRHEAGTHNMPGITGLLAGVRFVRRLGVEEIRRHETALKDRFLQNMAYLPQIETFSSREPGNQTGVVSFRIPGRDCEEICQQLGDRGFALRSGLHCAPLAHTSAGTEKTGTIRFSVSVFNRPREVDALAAELKKFTK